MAENQDEILRDRSKNPNPGESESAPEKPDYEQQIIEIIKTITAPKVLRNKLDDFHAYDIGDTFEKLTNFEREKLYRMLDTERLTEILEYLDEEDQARYLNEMNIKKVISIINEMEPDKAADLLREIDKEKRDIILELLEPEVRKNISTIFSYDDEEIGSKMTTNYIEVPRGISVKQAMRHLLDQAPENDNISTIYVQDENGMYYGAITLKDLIIARPDTDLEDIITTSYPYLYATEPIDRVVEELKDYNEDSIPILNNDNMLLGIITAQDLLEVLDEEMGEDYARLAGLSSEEDLEETLFDSLKKRLPWLIVLLFLGLVVSSVVSMFEGVVAQLTIVMAFQALILGMAGNAGTQSLGVTIRVLMDDSLTSKQKTYLIFKEAKVGFTNGLITGLVSFIFLGLYIHLAKGYGWFDAYAISGCIGVALWLAMLISSITGTTIPLLFKKVGVDPAVASGPLITTVNDLVGVVTYYGLAWIFLINMLHI
ncbi:magnesium transporter [Ileibacterium valens]|uniref:magnesium transporter n=1 Tax=Ileibacterium valens TaxID=1862668 RepID=UPI0024B8DAD6|nr:magnesium transporter [Ileibacterium valens]